MDTELTGVNEASINYDEDTMSVEHNSLKAEGTSPIDDDKLESQPIDDEEPTECPVAETSDDSVQSVDQEIEEGDEAVEIDEEDEDEDEDGTRRFGMVVPGAIGGVLIGSVTAGFAAHAYTNANAGQVAASGDETGATDEKVIGSELTDAPEPPADVITLEEPAIKYATGVDDDMSFNKAFAAARAEVGAGGAFEWRGQVYGTYYADEWDAMTADEKSAFGRNFDSRSADADYTNEVVAEVVTEEASDVRGYETDDELVTYINEETDVEILGVEMNDDDVYLASNDEVVLIDIVGEDECVVDNLGDVDFMA